MHKNKDDSELMSYDIYEWNTSDKISYRYSTYMLYTEVTHYYNLWYNELTLISIFIEHPRPQLILLPLL